MQAYIFSTYNLGYGICEVTIIADNEDEALLILNADRDNNNTRIYGHANELVAVKPIKKGILNITSYIE